MNGLVNSSYLRLNRNLIKRTFGNQARNPTFFDSIRSNNQNNSTTKITATQTSQINNSTQFSNQFNSQSNHQQNKLFSPIYDQKRSISITAFKNKQNQRGNDSSRQFNKKSKEDFQSNQNHNQKQTFFKSKKSNNKKFDFSKNQNQQQDSHSKNGEDLKM